MSQDTEDESQLIRTPDDPVPGIVVIFSAGAPAFLVVALVQGKLRIGREDLGGTKLSDGRLSREHADVSFDGKRWLVRDLGSRNGSSVDGKPVSGELAVEAPRLFRFGNTLCLPLKDVRRFAQAPLAVQEELILGPSTYRAHQEVMSAAKSGGNLLVQGESGTGKELAASTYAKACHVRGELVAVNCATITSGLAERILFGAKRGAYNGVTADAPGHVQAADGGVLFLDEVGELDPLVQPKLLRLIESKEFVPLGAASPRKVQIRFCLATHRDLRLEVLAGRFREDLFHRISEPRVVIPPLRERVEEIPWFIARAAASVSKEVAPNGKFVEACLLRHWPGNVRELVNEVRRAAQGALQSKRTRIHPEDLDAMAGMPAAPGAEEESKDALSADRVKQALLEQQWNVTAAARSLGIYRTQLYRLIGRYGIVLPRE